MIYFLCINFYIRYSGPDSKELIDPGLDLNMEGGLAEHAKDAFILTSATLFLALISGTYSINHLYTYTYVHTFCDYDFMSQLREI